MALTILMVILGGQRTLAGPVAAAVVVEAASEALRAYRQVRMVVFALAVLAVMRLHPAALVGAARGAAGSIPPVRRRMV